MLHHWTFMWLILQISISSELSFLYEKQCEFNANHMSQHKYFCHCSSYIKNLYFRFWMQSLSVILIDKHSNRYVHATTLQKLYITFFKDLFNSAIKKHETILGRPFEIAQKPVVWKTFSLNGEWTIFKKTLLHIL